jgi:hypothetical protein
MRRALRKIGPSNVTAVGSDNASVQYAAFLELDKMPEFAHLAWAPCGAHMGQRVACDVAVVFPEVKRAVKEDNWLCTYFRRRKMLANLLTHHISLDVSQPGVRLKHRRLKRFRSTRFCNGFKSLESTDSLRTILKQMSGPDGRICKRFAELAGNRAKDIIRRGKALRSSMAWTSKYAESMPCSCCCLVFFLFEPMTAAPSRS